VTTIVVLDTGPLGIITNPRQTSEVQACTAWLRRLLASGVRVVLPEIADYELRRELLRADKRNGLRRLDAAGQTLEYLPISTPMMRQASALWAQIRRQGLPTADARALDGDAILAAQALSLQQAGDTVTVATTNVQHLSRIVDAQLWEDITPA
jgi:predicted nucleic acid-binding protein